MADRPREPQQEGNGAGELNRLTKALEQVVQPECIHTWFQEPNPSFDGSTPAQIVERGESDRIWRMIHLLKAGKPG